MSAWRAERFSYIDEVTAFLNLRDLTSDQFKVVVASDNAQQPFVVFVREDEPVSTGAVGTSAAVVEPASGGVIEAAEAIVADAQHEDE